MSSLQKLEWYKKVLRQQVETVVFSNSNEVTVSFSTQICIYYDDLLEKVNRFFGKSVDMLGIEPKECRRTTTIRPVEWTVRDSNSHRLVMPKIGGPQGSRTPVLNKFVLTFKHAYIWFVKVNHSQGHSVLGSSYFVLHQSIFKLKKLTNPVFARFDTQKRASVLLSVILTQ